MSKSNSRGQRSRPISRIPSRRHLLPGRTSHKAPNPDPSLASLAGWAAGDDEAPQLRLPPGVGRPHPHPELPADGVLLGSPRSRSLHHQGTSAIARGLLEDLLHTVSRPPTHLLRHPLGSRPDERAPPSSWCLTSEVYVCLVACACPPGRAQDEEPEGDSPQYDEQLARLKAQDLPDKSGFLDQVRAPDQDTRPSAKQSLGRRRKELAERVAWLCPFLMCAAGGAVLAAAQALPPRSQWRAAGVRVRSCSCSAGRTLEGRCPLRSPGGSSGRQRRVAPA